MMMMVCLLYYPDNTVVRLQLSKGHKTCPPQKYEKLDYVTKSNECELYYLHTSR